ncbi:hypothetical protein VNI00_004183 [Paramarasmius palmivorus]|uniref:Hydrophobin n=1 Tax=Paramarasmius palmivorus TaxID=297713 RepID=A0AAW0DPQ7_9AGAR
MHFQVILAAFAFPAITLAKPLPHGWGNPGVIKGVPTTVGTLGSDSQKGGWNMCGSGGIAYCSDDDVWGSLFGEADAGKSHCSNGSVYCCYNNNNQDGKVNVNQGNCVIKNDLFDFGNIAELVGTVLGHPVPGMGLGGVQGHGGF